METIYRYNINEHENVLDLPIGAEVLSVGYSEEMVDLREEEDRENKELENVLTEEQMRIRKNMQMFGNTLADSMGLKKIPKEVLSLWARVDTDSSTEKRKFLVFGTGADMSALANFRTKFLGTVIKKNLYAFHVYEVSDK